MYNVNIYICKKKREEEEKKESLPSSKRWQP